MTEITEEIERMRQLGVTGICGDYPDRLRAIVDHPSG